MKLTTYIYINLILVILIVISCDKKEVVEQNKKPNILFIMSDDHAYQAISAYSNHLIQTPNIDRIANEGMLFTNACVNQFYLCAFKSNHINRKTHAYQW